MVLGLFQQTSFRLQHTFAFAGLCVPRFLLFPQVLTAMSQQPMEGGSQLRRASVRQELPDRVLLLFEMGDLQLSRVLLSLRLDPTEPQQAKVALLELAVLVGDH